MDPVRQRLIETLRGSSPSSDVLDWRIVGLDSEQGRRIRAAKLLPEKLVPAAVLIALVDHPQGLSVLLTQRAAALKNHAGQISFPGGRIESTETAADAALREASEEIGLDRGAVDIVGYLPDHFVITGFRVTPVVSLVRPGFDLHLDPREVENTFELPLEVAFDVSRYRLRKRQIADQEFELYDIPYGERLIWGATAGMLQTLRRMLYPGPTT